MMNNNDFTFKKLNDRGVEVECEVLCTFKSNVTQKNYVLYTDKTIDEEGNTKVFAATYDSDERRATLQPITTDYEWNLIERLLNDLKNIED